MKNSYVRNILLVLFSLTIMRNPAFAELKPDWVDGVSPRYPASSYMTGVGFGDDRQASENSAYGALSRIFRSEIVSVIEEKEVFLQKERSQKDTEVDRSIDIQSQTAVSSQMVLEQVQIVDHWVDSKTKVHYALAVINRGKVGSSLRQKMLEANLDAKTWEGRSKTAKNKLMEVRALRKAVLASKRADEYEGNLRVIDSGKIGLSDRMGTTTQLQDQLDTLLSEYFQVSVEVSGPHQQVIQSVLLEGLSQKGLISGPDAKLLVRANVQFREAGPKTPPWFYVRWMTQVTLINKEVGQVIGSFNRSGKEGQLSEEDAEEKALTALTQELNRTVGDHVSRFIFGE